MAKQLGMNPKKLPGLRPSSSQRWKLPVGAFIEECYAKRFGDLEKAFLVPDSGDYLPAPTQAKGAHGREVDHRGRRQASVAEDLLVHLANLEDDIARELSAGRVNDETIRAITDDLHGVVSQLERGDPVFPMPELGLPQPDQDEEPEAAGPPEIDSDDVPF